MEYRELHRMEIEEVVRRWQVNESQRAIARATGLARETVRKSLAATVGLGLSAPAHHPPNGSWSSCGGWALCGAADHARGAAGGDARSVSGSDRHLDRPGPPPAAVDACPSCSVSRVCRLRTRRCGATWAWRSTIRVTSGARVELSQARQGDAGRASRGVARDELSI
jgi:hypothetical protein